MKYLRHLIPLFFIFLPSSVLYAGDKQDAGTTAMDLLYSKLKNHPSYKNRIGCLALSVEKITESFVELVLREKRGKGCPGDPHTQPVVDRFKMNRKTGNFLRYDVIDAGFKENF